MHHQLCSIQVNLGVQRLNDVGLTVLAIKLWHVNPNILFGRDSGEARPGVCKSLEWYSTALIIFNIILTELTARSRILLEKLIGPQLVDRKSAYFMEPEGSLRHSQETANCSYPERQQSSPCPTIQLLEGPF